MRNLEYHRGFVTSGAHGFDDGWVGVIQIDEDVARITILRGHRLLHLVLSAIGDRRQIQNLLFVCGEDEAPLDRR
jgi:hypothetical protein